MNNYLHEIIEKYVQKFWKKNKTFKSIDYILNKEKYYCLSMFPYPSGKIHLGHVRNYTIGDIFARFNRMIGKNVLYPIGWDSFGLPAENAAINNNITPEKWTFYNINYMRKQLKLLGFSFDWDREIITCNKNYYKWEQLFFKELYKNKIVYKKYSPVNWCNIDKTVLANEQIINNSCWRCNSKISIRYINQWFLKITNYSDKLLNDLKELKYWPEEVKLMQSNWIGKSKWIKIEFILINFNKNIIEINFKNISEYLNINYIIISLKNNLSKKIIKEIINKKNINFYNNDIYQHIKKYGYIKTNIIAINYLINLFIPIIIFNNNYFLYIYYLKYNKKNYNNNELLNYSLYKEYINLNKFNEKFIENYNNLYDSFCLSNINNINKKKYFYNNINNFIKTYFKYKIQDWCISRQRYWGVPIPIIKLDKKIISIPNSYIPLKLEKFHNYYDIKKNYKNKIIINNKIAYLDNDTLDTFIQSSWYYIRYTCPKYNKFMINKKSANYWLPIDQYVGGIEHSTMHLLYFRFYNKLLKDFNFIKNNEPAIKLLCQGMVLSDSYYYIDEFNKKKWINFSEITFNYDKNKNKLFYDKNKNKLFYNGLNKMSKSKNNGVDPDLIIKKYGSDTLRVFLIFSSPAKCNLIWKENNIIGVYRFLKKIWLLTNLHIKNKKDIYYKNIKEENKNLIKILYFSIKNITYDIKIKQSLNTSISNLMNLTNIIIKIILKKKYNYIFINDSISVLLKMLYPFAPHISFFLWNKLGFSNIDYSNWPDLNKYKNDSKYIFYKIQINNKFKINININKYINKKNTINYIYNVFFKKKYFKKIYKIIFIKNKLINFLLK